VTEFQNPKRFTVWRRIGALVEFYRYKLRGTVGAIYELSLRNELKRCGFLCNRTSKVIWNPNSGGLIFGKNTYLGVYSVLFIGDDHRGGASKGRVELGSDVYIGDHCNIRAAGGLIHIGSKVLVANHVTMIAANHGMALGIPMFDQPWANEPLDVFIDDDCWIGAHVTLLPGTRIMSGAVVAAGAVVTGTVPSNEIWGGVPARKISQRTPEPTGAR
jgi:acetyltransferase-like isoleucine patch superfamily enzyme